MKDLYAIAANLYGGYSRVTDEALGEAIYGHACNGDLRGADATEISRVVDNLALAVSVHWEGTLNPPSYEAIKGTIIRSLARAYAIGARKHYTPAAVDEYLRTADVNEYMP